MNLVIDDAVEVKLATKTEEEKRRPLGRSFLRADRDGVKLERRRADRVCEIQARFYSRATTCR